MKHLDTTNKLAWLLIYLSIGAIIMSFTSCRTVQKAQSKSSKDSTATTQTKQSHTVQINDSDTSHSLTETWTEETEEPVINQVAIQPHGDTIRTHVGAIPVRKHRKTYSRTITRAKATKSAVIKTNTDTKQSISIKKDNSTKHVDKKPINPGYWYLWLVIILVIIYFVVRLWKKGYGL